MKMNGTVSLLEQLPLFQTMVFMFQHQKWTSWWLAIVLRVYSLTLSRMHFIKLTKSSQIWFHFLWWCENDTQITRWTALISELAIILSESCTN